MTARNVIIGSAVGAVVAAFLPWVSFLGVSVSGWQGGDGKVTVAAGLAGVALVAAFWRAPQRRMHGVAQVVLGGIVAVVGLVDMTNFAAGGIYLTVACGAAWIVAAVVLLRTGRAVSDAGVA